VAAEPATCQSPAAHRLLADGRVLLDPGGVVMKTFAVIMRFDESEDSEIVTTRFIAEATREGYADYGLLDLEVTEI
jgi:hypothetical protein